MDYNRMSWGSRRGMLELDLILMPFMENIFSELSEEDQKRYEMLLGCEDQDMYAWFLKRQDPSDPEILKIVQIIRENTGVKG